MRGNSYLGKDNLSGKKKYNNGIIAKYFIPGTQPDGWVEGSTEEKKKKNSEAQKKVWTDDNYRQHWNELHNSPEYYKIKQEAGRKSWKTSNYDERCKALSVAAKHRFEDEQERKLASDRMVSKWEDSDYRDKQTQSLKVSHQNLYAEHPEYKDKLSQANKKAWKEHKVEILNKQYTTKKENNSFNSSKAEDNYYIYLLGTYDEDDIVRQYSTDPRYPFNCDFYIKSEDLFIEINAHWSHGSHPFDEMNLDDIYKLEQWEEKAKTSDYYKNAIKVWTITDPLKIQTAKENNLNIKFIY